MKIKHKRIMAALLSLALIVGTLGTASGVKAEEQEPDSSSAVETAEESSDESAKETSEAAPEESSEAAEEESSVIQEDSAQPEDTEGSKVSESSEESSLPEKEESSSREKAEEPKNVKAEESSDTKAISRVFEQVPAGKEPEAPTDGRVLVILKDGMTVTAFTFSQGKETTEDETASFYLPKDAERRGILFAGNASVQYLTADETAASEPAVWSGTETSYEFSDDTAEVIVSKPSLLARMRAAKAPTSSNWIQNNGYGIEYTDGGNMALFTGNDNSGYAYATYFTSNFGEGVAFCGSVGKDVPLPMGETKGNKLPLEKTQEVTDQNIRKILYYGYKGPAQWSGFATAQYKGPGFEKSDADISGREAVIYFATHDQLSKYNTANAGSKSGGLYRNVAMSSEYEAFWTKQADPPEGFHVYVYRSGSSAVQDMFVWEMEKTGKAELVKTSTNSALTSGNSCYSLAGAEYTVYSDKALTKKVGVLTTDAGGKSNTLELAAGTYYYWETKAPKGFYANSGKVKSNPPSFKVESGKTYTIKEQDYPGADPFRLVVDKVSDDGADVDLSGAQFTLEFYGGYYTNADEAKKSGTPLKKWILETKRQNDGTYRALLLSPYLVSGSDDFYIIGGLPTLPLGTLLVSESKAPGNGEFTADGPFTDSEGNTGDPYFVVQIRENPETNGFTHYYVDTIKGTLSRKYVRGEELDLTKTDEHVRGDFSFTKTTSSGKKLSGVSFTLTQDATGTTYTVTTGADGSYASKDDAGLRRAFGAADGKGSLPFGSYTLTEISGKANAGFELAQPVHFTISQNGTVLDLGSISNYKPVIQTKLMTSDQHKTPAVTSQKVTLVDYVTYSDFNNHTSGTYHVSGRLVDPSTGKTATDKDGNELTAEKDVTFDASGTGVITLEYPAVDPYTFAGKSLVSFCTITKDGKALISEEDAANADQTVKFPSVHTTAKDTTGRNGTDVLPAADKTVTIVDTVKYANLIKGKDYSVTATLMDKKTGKAVTDGSGKAVTVSKDFTADDTDGSVDVTITVPTALVSGKTTVVFEDLYEDGRDIYAHTDINDKDQTVLVPSIHTTAKDEEGNLGKEMIDAKDETVTIVDTVSYSALKPETEYTVKGSLMNAETGEAVKGSDGNGITAQTTFTTGKAAGEEVSVSGTVDVTFTVPSSVIKGTTTVVFESLYEKDLLLTAHEDLTDKDQTVIVPEIHTTAEDSETKDHVSQPDKNVTIIDTVKYTNLIPGRNYTVSGTLMDQATGEELLIEGKPVTAEVSFTTKEADGSIDLTFTFDGSALADKTYVAFESMKTNSREVAVHADIHEEEQTIHFPEIHTTLTDTKTEDHIAKAEEEVTLTDTVAYKNLVPGKEYTMTGVLMQKDLGNVLMAAGKPVTVSQTFTPEKADGTVELTFTFDGSALAGKDVVAFESLSRNGKAVAVHADINDEGQTVHFPNIYTTATDSETEYHISKADKEVTIVDHVDYTDLIAGKEYTVTGTLMDKDTGKALTVDGKEVAASTTFTAEKADGAVDVIFTFDGSALAGKTVVAFETATYEGKEVAVHADIDDEGQTVHFPDVHTTATDSETKDHTSMADEKVTIVDRVAYTNLIPGKEYTVSGKLMQKDTGKALTDNGKEVATVTTFIADKANGYVDMTFTFNGSALAGKKTVAFETVTYTGKEVAVHADLKDEDQTVAFPSIHTTATVNGHKEVQVDAKNVSIKDVLTYTNLVPGKKYRIEAQAIDAKTNEEAGKATLEFTADKADGTVSIDIPVDVANREEHSIVVFESVYESDTKTMIGSHKDLKDKDQTIFVKKLPPKTGDHTQPFLFGGIFLAAVAAAVILIIRRRRTAKD